MHLLVYGAVALNNCKISTSTVNISEAAAYTVRAQWNSRFTIAQDIKQAPMFR